MTTDADYLCVTDPVLHRLAVALDRLRTEQQTILDANRTLVEYGLTSGSPEVHTRVHAIQAEAATIAARLHALGAHDQADTAIVLTSGASL
ncbi:hypothetical protein Dvina_45055 [Dactylosporangium vinaceum]|uniref:Uncharacterized protein n=1 Tax=Dactylosporangium vinaceum TaxID=53362 RepID=A0ABV5MIN0_9ACTN|nr:hypothetical protein [Dactylosporangium vinaceum]UAB95145.1 hypothetical protein Dvina_45055 [Dactylosporangium vinaceum]